MISHEVPLSDPSSKWMPKFLQELQSLGDEVGYVEAVHKTLEHDNISVNIEGDFDQLKEHPGGVLFIGDHKNSWEYIAAMEMVSQMGHDDMLNVTKFYVERKVRKVLGQTASRLLLPVYPRILARDRDNIFNYEIFNRFLHRKHLLTLAESREANNQAALIASERLISNGVVNIYPTGKVVDAGHHPWREGVRRIIQKIPEHDKGNVLIAPYTVTYLSRIRFMGAIATRGRGRFGEPQRQ